MHKLRIDSERSLERRWESSLIKLFYEIVSPKHLAEIGVRSKKLYEMETNCDQAHFESTTKIIF